MLADARVVDADVVVTQSEAGDKAGRRQVHLCGDADEVGRVEARLTTLVSTVTVADLAQRLGTQRHRARQVHERSAHCAAGATPHTCHRRQTTHFRTSLHLVVNFGSSLLLHSTLVGGLALVASMKLLHVQPG